MLGIGEGWGVEDNSRGTNIDLYRIPISEAAHVAFGEKAIGEEREEHEFWERQKFVS